MTPDVSQLDKMEPYTGKDRVIVGNRFSLPVTHIGSCSSTPTLQLKDVFVVPNLTKNLLSVSKLTNDFPLAVLFTDNKFIIQNLQTQKVVASGDRVDGLYVLKRGHHVFSAIINKYNLCNSFDIWHAHLGHVSSQIISMFNKKGFFYLLPLYCQIHPCV
jgi:cAMP phosphodiesterase